MKKGKRIVKIRKLETQTIVSKLQSLKKAGDGGSKYFCALVAQLETRPLIFF